MRLDGVANTDTKNPKKGSAHGLTLGDPMHVVILRLNSSVRGFQDRVGD